MPKFLEEKLKREYGEKSAIPYKVMNSIGAMRGNKETAKGEQMERKHEADMKKSPFHHTMITHHDDGSHTVEHHPHVKSSGKSAAFMERGEPTTYSVGDHKELMSKLTQHLGAGTAKAVPAGANEMEEEEEEGEPA